MQGSTGDNRFSNDFFSDWQSASGLNPELHQRQSDHLQPGDAIRIYAINRATGYIGHTDTTMQAGTLGEGDLSFHIDPIIMGPPNLKIRAERDYKIQRGVTASDERITQLIGFEGASLTSDSTVTITTEWLDHQGRPMPESLEGAGYTGRIAILSGNQTLPNDNQGVFHFSINPGRRLQVLQLPNALASDSQHFYIHVSGEPKNGNPDFGGDPIFGDSTDNVRTEEANFKSTGQNPGILTKRPDHYVPFLVPIFDEVNTELQTQAYRLLKETNPEQFSEAPAPIYKWVYRPEMQFTSYDLNVNAINKSRDANDNGTIEVTETINILNDDTPLIPSDSIVSLLYDLSTTDLLPLGYFNAGTEKELIFVVGEQEIRATLGDNQELIFDDLSHLDLLSPDDFLTIRLYANNDVGNTLWQYAFKINGLHVYYKIPHDETEITLEINGTSERVRTLGGIRLKYEYILPAGAYFNGTNDFIKWKMGVPGRYCSDFGVESTGCTDDTTGTLEYKECHTDPANNNAAGQATRCAMYWEPLDPSNTAQTLWNTTLNASSTVDVDYTKQDSSDGLVDQPFTVETRELFPVTATRTNPTDGSTDPIVGHDIAMLETLLWQLGIAPNSQKPNIGYNGTRKASDRDVFDLGCHSSVDNCVGPATTGTTATMETMVWRFKYPNEINADPNDVDIILNHSVTAEMLSVLKDQWNDYYIAYTAFNSSPTITHDHTVSGSNVYNDDDETTTQDWASHAIQQWSNTFDIGALTNLRTLVNVNTLTREMLIEGWSRKEAAQGHWGWSGDNYRIVGGSADSKMSMGFSQVQSRYIYGLVSTGCNEIRDLNIMHPRDNLAGFAVWSAFQGCGESFFQAFAPTRPYDEPYDNTQTVQLLRVRYGVNVQPLLLQANNVVQDFDETNYERLTKGIAGYNQGFSAIYWGAESFANTLRRLNLIDYSGNNEEQKCQNYPDGTNDRRRCIGYLYGGDVKERAEIPLASYQWRTQVPMNVGGTIQPVDVCFWYGEEEWRQRTWEAQRDLSVANNNYACPVP